MSFNGSTGWDRTKYSKRFTAARNLDWALAEEGPVGNS